VITSNASQLASNKSLMIQLAAIAVLITTFYLKAIS
jgi:hypothetical protein